MIISCPSCSARYDIDDSRFLPAGRSVRCSSCQTSWFVPAPQGVETLMPSARIRDSQSPSPADQGAPADEGLFAKSGAEGAASGMFGDEPRATPMRRANDRTSDRTSDREGFSGREEPRPQRGPMAERRKEAPASRSASHDNSKVENATPLRRTSDRVVDTDWREVPTKQNMPGADNVGEGHHGASRNHKSSAGMSGNKSSGDGRGNGDDPTTILGGAPGEVFASVSVQPRELENALKRVRRKAKAREKNRLTPLRLVGWAMLLSAVCGLFFAGYTFRDEIVRFAPGSAAVYATVGIEASPYGLDLQNIDYRVALSTTGPVIELTGELLNEDERAIAPPLLLAEALDMRGKLLASWTFDVDQAEIAAGDIASFSTRAPAPEGMVEVVLSFAPQESVKRK